MDGTGRDETGRGGWFMGSFMGWFMGWFMVVFR